jgi:hypothetical protein
MNTELMNEIKQVYINWLRTKEGIVLKKVSIGLLREWTEERELENIFGTGIVVSTEGVKLSCFKNKLFKKRLEKIKIIPLGLNNICHKNSEVLSEINGIDRVLGYNITACPCGKKICFEIHSVNRIEGKLYDMTRDFNGEKEKWFLPIRSDLTANSFIKAYGNTPRSINNNCRCNITWNEYGGIKQTETDFLEFIKRVES